MTIRVYVAIAALIGTVLAEAQLELPVARLTFKVIDEDRTPIPAATVKVTFEQASAAWGGGGKMHPITGLTDDKGEFTAEGHSLDTKGGRVEKAGYYSSSPEAVKFEKVVAGKWHPWNPTVEVVLKKVVRPVPMYARFNSEVELPVSNQPVGFDLIESDWVPPYGHGNTADLVFSCTVPPRSEDASSATELTVSFSNDGDGLQPIVDTSRGASRLRSAHEAPENGYVPKVTLSRDVSGTAGGSALNAETANYYFRIRTVLNSDGRVVQALYGKVYNGIECFATGSNPAKLRFTYYVNPTPNDRGVEFDTRANLFQRLSPNQTPTEP